jgi:hypothetical protein
VVSTWPEIGDYYLHTDVQEYTEVVQQVEDDRDTRYWFVIDPPTAWTNPDLKAWVETHATLVGVQPLRAPDDQSVWVYLFDPHQPAAY